MTVEAGDGRNKVSDLLARRMLAQQRRDQPRCWGRSSDALALYAVGAGRRPRTPGVPDSQGPSGFSFRGENTDWRCPSDPSDLLACELTYEMGDEAEQERMLPALIEFRSWVLDGITRTGDVVAAKGYRERVFAMEEWVPYRHRWIHGSPAAPEVPVAQSGEPMTCPSSPQQCSR